FLMEPQFRAAAGAAAWQISNPPILAAAPLIASLAIFTEARMERLRAKSVQLTYFLEQLLRPLQEQVHLITPRDRARRGCQLARRGLSVTLHERRPDPRQARPERGRSINLALAARGMRALERAGVLERVRPLLIPMRGRMVHELSGQTALQPYGQREHEVIW